MKCSECDRELYGNETICPRCQSKSDRKKKQGGLFVAFIGVLAFTAKALLASKASNKSDKSDKGA